MADTGHHGGKPPKYDGKMCVMKYKAWLHNVGCGAVLASGFNATLTAMEATFLDLAKPTEKANSEALNKYYKATKGLILAFKTPEMMDKIIEEQAEDDDWPGEKFTHCQHCGLESKQMRSLVT